jgi:ribonuclease P protein component
MNHRHRLKSSKDFKRVRHTGKSYAHPLVVLISSPNLLPLTRFGITASKAVGSAVSRNRAKRRIRAAIQLNLPKIKTGWDVVLIARAPLIEAEWSEICKALTDLLDRAKILKEEE